MALGDSSDFLETEDPLSNDEGISSEADSESTSSSGTSSDSFELDPSDHEVSENDHSEVVPSDEESSDSSAVEADQSSSSKKAKVDRPSEDLQSRISSFLPQLKQANKELENTQEIQARQIDAVADDDDHYIEMNLGLGVLKQLPTPGDPINFESSGSSSEEEEFEENEEADTHLLEKLKGTKTEKTAKRKIEEIS